ncbi:hypothetical protein [Pseudonocardia sp. GCM10023141]|uniref:hypothetical protein n=1 Tax=Pseudonocardia sp. GCM10023141 TaxID=3252653 RepID=UPI00360C067B
MGTRTDAPPRSVSHPVPDGIRRPDFGGKWGVTVDPAGRVAILTMDELYAMWVGFLRLLTELAAAAAADGELLDGLRSDGDGSAARGSIVASCASRMHQRFLDSYHERVLGADLLAMAACTRDLSHPAGSGVDLRAAIAEATATSEARVTAAFSDRMRTVHREIGDAAGAAADASAVARVGAWSALLVRTDRAFLDHALATIREGVLIFEELGAATMADGGRRLCAVLDRMPSVIRTYHRSVVVGLDAIGSRHGDLPGGSFGHGLRR